MNSGGSNCFYKRIVINYFRERIASSRPLLQKDKSIYSAEDERRGLVEGARLVPDTYIIGFSLHNISYQT